MAAPSTFVEQWLDSAYPLDNEWDPEQFAVKQRERIILNIIIAEAAHAIPRRLGADATPPELAKDKKLNKRLRARWISILHLWEGQPADVEEYKQHHQDSLQSLNTVAMQRNWHEFMAGYVVEMRDLLANAANNAVNKGENRTANRYCNRLLNELTQIHQLYQEIYG